MRASAVTATYRSRLHPRSGQHRGRLQQRRAGAEGRVARRAEGGIVALLGANGAGKTTTLKGDLELLRAERGEVTKGEIVSRASGSTGSRRTIWCGRGAIQVMEGRHCFGHLTIEENLLTGAFTRRDGARRGEARPREGLCLFSPPQAAPQLARRLYFRRRAADVRDRPRDDGEPEARSCSTSLRWGSRRRWWRRFSRSCATSTRARGVSFLLAEQNTNIALRYAEFGYILENGRVVLDGAAERAARQRGRARILSRRRRTERRSFRDVKSYKPPQALAVA